MIEFRNVWFGYNDKPVLKGVSFIIPEGESRVFMGQSGSGKSTILKLILGLYRPNSGSILVDNCPIESLSETELEEVRRHIGMVFQDGALFDSMTVGENVGFYLIEHSAFEVEEIERLVRQMLGYVGLGEEIIDLLPDELSGGMQRRVAIARALLSTDPKVMLYDEPTTGLDPESTLKALTLMNKLTRERRVSTIAVTHQIVDAIELSSNFVLIDDGQVAFDGSLLELRDCPDDRVVQFLRPFRDAVSEMRRKEFM